MAGIATGKFTVVLIACAGDISVKGRSSKKVGSSLTPLLTKPSSLDYVRVVPPESGRYIGMANTEVNQLICRFTGPSTFPIRDRAAIPLACESINLQRRDIDDKINQQKSSSTFLAYAKVGNNDPTSQIKPNARRQPVRKIKSVEIEAAGNRIGGFTNPHPYHGQKHWPTDH